MRFPAFRSVLLLVIALLVLPGCDSQDDGLACTTEARPAIAITIMTDGGDTPADGIYDVTVTDGDFSEMAPVVAGSASLAHERAGTYHVEVTAGESSTWSMDAVEVTSGECHVNTREFTVLVEPS